MRRRLWVSMIGTVVFVVLLFIANIVTGNTPILGLDLQGGVSVILAPVEQASGDDLVVIRDLIRSELENRGIAEPDVRVQGETIVVDLPGVKDQQKALDAVNVSGVVELRPVVNPSDCATSSVATSSVVPTSSESPAPPDSPAGSVPVTTAPPVGNSVTTDPATPAGFRRAASARLVPAQTVPQPTVPEPTTLDPPAPEPVTTPPISPSAPPISPSAPPISPSAPPISPSAPPISPSAPPISPSAPPISPSAPGAVLLPTRDGQNVCVGPAQGTGEVFERGSAKLTADQGWGVSVDLRGDGQATWNSLANQCYNTAPTCPSTQPGVRGQIAITLDSVVQSSPQVNQPNFSDAVAITGSFARSEAEDLAAVLNRGAFPVEVAAQEARTVSASAGADSLNAAIIAGLVGLAMVLMFLFAYYRWLALVIVAGLGVWSLLVFSAASLISGWTNYALSLAGVTGIIVAVGVTVDSYVVFFERIKDELRNGRSLRNGAPRSFAVTWRTIWVADLVSMIAAIILFTLSVGSVRGFALYLGITTFCDLIVCYSFTRPAVLLLAGSNWTRNRSVLGIKVLEPA